METATHAAPCVVVAGAPGAGKSLAAKSLARLLNPRPAVIDKDIVYDDLVRFLLTMSGHDADDREAEWYSNNVKPLEYAGLISTAREIRSNGCPVIVVAPFYVVAHDDTAWTDLINQLGEGPVSLVWMRCSESVLIRRIERRNLNRDFGKLNDREAFLKRNASALPSVRATIVDNDGTVEELESHMQSVASFLTSEFHIWMHSNDHS